MHDALIFVLIIQRFCALKMYFVLLLVLNASIIVVSVYSAFSSVLILCVRNLFCIYLFMYLFIHFKFYLLLAVPLMSLFSGF